MKRFSLVLAALFASIAATPTAVDTAFKKFFDAESPVEAAKAAEPVVKANVAFDDAYARLKKGRTYAADAPRGVVRASHTIDNDYFGYTMEVPANYDSTRAYQVRVQLHGGVMGRVDGTLRGSGSIGALAGAEQIYVMPLGWADAPWWGDKQIHNLRAILDSLKRSYNVDENRIVLSGVSDGATAEYYFAMRDTMPYAAFLTLNGALAVLQNPSIDIDGELYPQNLVNKPFFMVNGGKDPLYPADLVEPYIDHMKQNGVEVLYHMQPNGVHNTTWWPQEKDAFETFVREHPRKPYPDTLTWETDMTGDTSRAHWLVIDALTKERTKFFKPDLNDYSPSVLGRFGLKADGTKVVRTSGGSSASTFFFEPGDVVTSVQGQAVAPDGNLADILSRIPQGRMTVTVSRGGKSVELSGYFSPGSGDPTPMFFHRRQSGRVDLVRSGNTIGATTAGVAEFTLLISPDVFDFNKPVTVIADGKTVFEGRVRKNLGTLMKWAARDNDRTMLFGAEIDVKLPR